MKKFIEEKIVEMWFFHVLITLPIGALVVRSLLGV